MGNSLTDRGQALGRIDRETAGGGRTLSLSRWQALVDVVVVVSVMAGVWSLRFAGVGHIGALTMAAGLIAVGIVLLHRRQAARTLGLARPQSISDLMSKSMRLLALFGLVWLASGLIVTALLGQPETSKAITGQPQSLWAFILDITIVTWGLIAFGEEVVFRGFILQRLLLVLGESKVARFSAIGLQSVIFGAGHASQGLSGIFLTAAIGFVFGWYFLTQAKRSLWPLILVHGAADTVILTAAWLV